MLRHVEKVSRRLASKLDEAALERLIDDYIEQDPLTLGVGGARTRREAIPVWALIGYLEAASGDINRVTEDYEIPADAVRAAIAYYRRHPIIIQAFILDNELLTTEHSR